MNCSDKPFDFSSSLAKYGLCHNSSVAPSHYLLHRKKKLDRPKSEKKLESCKLTKELSLADLIHDMPRDSCNNQPSVRLSSTDSLGSPLSKNLDTDLRPPVSECVSKEDSAFKGIPDLKSLMIKKSSTPNDSLFIQNSSLPDFQNISVQNSLGNLSNSLHLTSSLENTSDNLNTSKNTEVGSVPLVEQSAMNYIFRNDGLQFSQCESSSFPESFLEHKENSPSQHFTLSDLCNQTSASVTDLSLGSFSLSHLADHCQSSTGISELTGSLSSLAFCQVSPTRDLENLSLSDLIAETIDVDNSQIKKDSFEISLSELRSPGTDSNIDLSVLIKTPDFLPKPTDYSVAPVPENKVVSSKLEKKSNSAKDNKKNSNNSLARKPPFSLSWTKALAARPSAFASTLCLRYPLKNCKRRTLDLYKTFLYSRQVQDVKDREISPLVAITPFDFKSASPDDIVKANQKKAFTRE